MRSGATTTIALAMVVASPHVVKATDYGVGPWYVLVERDHAVAVLNDPDRTWTLMVRCTDGHIDFVVRRIGEGAAPGSRMQRYQATLQIDSKPTAHLAAQDWSMGGYLILDVGSLLPSLEAGLQIDFRFENDVSNTEMNFLAAHTTTALEPIRDRCPAGVS